MIIRIKSGIWDTERNDGPTHSPIIRLAFTANIQIGASNTYTDQICILNLETKIFYILSSKKYANKQYTLKHISKDGRNKLLHIGELDRIVIGTNGIKINSNAWDTINKKRDDIHKNFIASRSNRFIKLY